MRSQSPLLPKSLLGSSHPNANALAPASPTITNFFARYPSREVVKNALGTQHDSVQGGWLQYYMDRGGILPSTCSAEGCLGPADVGGHVWVKRLMPASHTYIIPLCYYHNNQRGAEYAIKPDVTLCPRY